MSEPASMRPPWLRPVALVAALALHGSFAWLFVATSGAPPSPLGDIVVGLETAAPDTAPEETTSPVANEALPPDPEPTPSPNPTETMTSEPMLSPTEAPSPEPTSSPTETPAPEPTPSPSPTESFSPEPRPTLEPSPRPRPPIPVRVAAHPPPPPLAPKAKSPPHPPKTRPRPTQDQTAQQHEQPEGRYREAHERAAERNPGGAQGGRSGAPLVSTADFASYAVLVSAEIARHKNPSAVREAGSVRIAFTIGASGRVASHAIAKSSGSATLDAAANAMMYAVQAPPPPSGSFRGQITIRFQMQ